MVKTETISFRDFMSGEYKQPVKKKKRTSSIIKRVGTSIAVPLILAKPVFAAEAIPVGATQWMGETTLSTLAHALDPVVDILVALSFPIASVIIVGACFYFMFNNAEKAWGMIQNAGLGYVLVQVSPVILDVLKQVGNAV